MIIEPLCDHSSDIPILTEWYRLKWEPYYGAGGPGNAESDLVSRCNRDKIPYGFVAIHNDRLVGTAALDVDVSTNLTPSVVGLLVGPEYRHRGIATALLEAAVDRAPIRIPTALREYSRAALTAATTGLGRDG